MKKKVLIIRFNSIGDIVLTSPVVQALSNEGYEVHYLCKKTYSSLLSAIPNITKAHLFDGNLAQTTKALSEEKFHYIIDLHNNYRSNKVARALRVKAHRLQKQRIKLFLLTKLNFKVQPQKHIVDRFMQVVSPLLSTKMLSTQVRHQVTFDIGHEQIRKINSLKLPSTFVAISIGAAYYTKRIPTDKIIEIINGLSMPVVLLGGKDDRDRSNDIVTKSVNDMINLVGAVSIIESAEVINRSKVLITGDTGLMHIGAAIGVPIVAVFGSTHPVLGYTPYYHDQAAFSIIENIDLKCRPCTKQGRASCPKGHFNCMNNITTQSIIKEIKRFI